MQTNQRNCPQPRPLPRPSVEEWDTWDTFDLSTDTEDEEEEAGGGHDDEDHVSADDHEE